MNTPIVPYGYRPVILASDEEAATKLRKVEIYKNEVYKDIDLYTHKHVDGSQSLQDLRARNAVSSDNAENVDGAVIARYVEFRDAQLRTRLRSLLVDKTQEYADDDITLEDNKYYYWFNAPESFNDNALRPMAEYIHRFLVFGALADWYYQFGMQQQGAVYESQLDGIIDALSGLLRGPSIVKRPMQPFGPAEKIY